tara:strand:- start:5425 stop:5847 length:423 start_codon:yes stop_codon:yes gene_type:complete
MKFKSLIILMDTLKERGIQYISGRVIRQNDAVMFDIDDTLIYTDGTPIKPMIELLYIARHLGYKIIIITARPGIKTVIDWTINQLGKYNIPSDYLGFTSASTKTLMKNQLPYNFILSVGDLETDLTDSIHRLNTSNFFHS